MEDDADASVVGRIILAWIIGRGRSFADGGNMTISVDVEGTIGGFDWVWDSAGEDRSEMALDFVAARKDNRADTGDGGPDIGSAAFSKQDAEEVGDDTMEKEEEGGFCEMGKPIFHI